jgi:hypothetical protein
MIIVKNTHYIFQAINKKSVKYILENKHKYSVLDRFDDCNTINHIGENDTRILNECFGNHIGIINEFFKFIEGCEFVFINNPEEVGNGNIHIKIDFCNFSHENYMHGFYLRKNFLKYITKSAGELSTMEIE